MTNDRVLYLIRYSGDCFDPGTTKQNEQALIGIYEDLVVGVFFDKAGRELRNEIQTKTTVMTPKQQSDAWKNKLGFTLGRISVEAFFLAEYYTGIMNLPTHLDKFLRDPSFVPTAEERTEWQMDIDKWRVEGNFVLCWERDYWMNVNGEIIAT
jgi:hypothetical protein